MTHLAPCQRPENNPDDWFISRDGKQYADEDLITEDDVAAHLAEVDPNGTATVEEVDKIWDRLEANAKREALRDRRHAKEACRECYFRTDCLGKAIEEGHGHGTWGGYYEEELRSLRSEIDRRKRARGL